jgi:hypothetical protein
VGGHLEFTLERGGGSSTSSSASGAADSASSSSRCLLHSEGCCDFSSESDRAGGVASASSGWGSGNFPARHVSRRTSMGNP